MKYHVYVLLDPRTCPEKPFYIGISNLNRARSGSRVLEHYKSTNLDSSSSEYRNAAKSNLIKKLNNLGYQPCFYILDEVSSSKEAFELERYYIKRFGRLDNNTGVLYNKTDGGESTQGLVYTDEMRHKASVVKRKYPESLVDYCLYQRFYNFLSAKQISRSEKVSPYGLNYQHIQAWIEGKSYKEVSKNYPTIVESDANLCLQIHVDILSGKKPKEVKEEYNLSNGTYTRIMNFEFKWSKFKDYVNEIISIGGNL